MGRDWDNKERNTRIRHGNTRKYLKTVVAVGCSGKEEKKAFRVEI